MIINDKWPAQPRSPTRLALPGFDRRAWLPPARRPARYESHVTSYGSQFRELWLPEQEQLAIGNWLLALGS